MFNDSNDDWDGIPESRVGRHTRENLEEKISAIEAKNKALNERVVALETRIANLEERNWAFSGVEISGSNKK